MKISSDINVVTSLLFHNVLMMTHKFLTMYFQSNSKLQLFNLIKPGAYMMRIIFSKLTKSIFDLFPIFLILQMIVLRIIGVTPRGQVQM